MNKSKYESLVEILILMKSKLHMFLPIKHHATFEDLIIYLQGLFIGIQLNQNDEILEREISEWYNEIVNGSSSSQMWYYNLKKNESHLTDQELINKTLDLVLRFLNEKKMNY